MKESNYKSRLGLSKRGFKQKSKVWKFLAFLRENEREERRGRRKRR